MIKSVLEFGVLGPLSLTADGQEVALPGIRPRRLLACLVLHVGRPVALATLIDAVDRITGEDLVDRQIVEPESVEQRVAVRISAGADRRGRRGTGRQDEVGGLRGRVGWHDRERGHGDAERKKADTGAPEPSSLRC